MTICTQKSVSGKEVLNKVGWAFSPTLKYCWGRNPNLQKAISSASRKATRHVRGDLVPAFTLAEVFSPYYLSPRRIAFTLAEVLITLCIIGVVAAMTLPTLIANYNKHVIAAKLKKFYTIMNQAVELSEAQYGEFKYWDNSFPGNNLDEMQNWWDKYFAPHIKTMKTERVNNRLYVYLADGTKLYIFNFVSSNADSTVPTSAIHLAFFPFANPKEEILGKTMFSFFINSDINKKWAMVEPYKYGWDGTMDGLINGTYGCRNSDTPINRYYCTALIQMNNWEIPDNYPFKF